MFWAAVASLLMLLSGSGDDTRVFRERTEALKQAIRTFVSDAGRQQRAIEAVERNDRAFRQHRERLAVSNECIIGMDKTYDATRGEYLACLDGLTEAQQQAISEMMSAHDSMRAELSPQEWAQIEETIRQ